MQKNRKFISEKYIALTEHGFLVDRDQWNPEIAEALAEKNKIILTQQHWLIINCLRNFYRQYQMIPPLRIFIKHLRSVGGDEVGNSQKLHELFPETPMKWICLIGGLPKPKHCM